MLYDCCYAALLELHHSRQFIVHEGPPQKKSFIQLKHEIQSRKSSLSKSSMNFEARHVITLSFCDVHCRGNVWQKWRK